MKTQLSPQDWQQLSAYLDGQLSITEKERLETRLHTQTSLLDGLEEIRQTRAVLRSVPRRKVPHNFILTRAMVSEQARRRSAWFPVLGFTTLVSLVLLAAVSLLFQSQTNSAPAPVAMQAARSDQAGATQSASQPMIIQWGNGGVGGGGGGGGAVPQAANPTAGAYGLGGGQPQAPQNNPLMNGQATPEAGIEAAPAGTEVAVPKIAAPNTSAPTEAPAAVEITPTPGASVQEKQVPNQAESPVAIFGIAPTQDQGLIQSAPPVTQNYQAPGASANLLPVIQAGLIILAVTAGILAFLLRKKT